MQSFRILSDRGRRGRRRGGGNGCCIITIPSRHVHTPSIINPVIAANANQPGQAHIQPRDQTAPPPTPHPLLCMRGRPFGLPFARYPKGNKRFVLLNGTQSLRHGTARQAAGELGNESRADRGVRSDTRDRDRPRRQRRRRITLREAFPPGLMWYVYIYIY